MEMVGMKSSACDVAQQCKAVDPPEEHLDMISLANHIRSFLLGRDAEEERMEEMLQALLNEVDKYKQEVEVIKLREAEIAKQLQAENARHDLQAANVEELIESLGRQAAEIEKHAARERKHLAYKAEMNTGAQESSREAEALRARVSTLEAQLHRAGSEASIGHPASIGQDLATPKLEGDATRRAVQSSVGIMLSLLAEMDSFCKILIRDHHAPSDHDAQVGVMKVSQQEQQEIEQCFKVLDSFRNENKSLRSTVQTLTAALNDAQNSLERAENMLGDFAEVRLACGTSSAEMMAELAKAEQMRVQLIQKVHLSEKEKNELLDSSEKEKNELISALSSTREALRAADHELAKEYDKAKLTEENVRHVQDNLVKAEQRVQVIQGHLAEATERIQLLMQEKAELEKSLYDHEVVCDIMAKRVEEAIESGGQQGKTLVPRENQPGRPDPNTQDLQGLELCMEQPSVGTFTT